MDSQEKNHSKGEHTISFVSLVYSNGKTKNISHLIPVCCLLEAKCLKSLHRLSTKHSLT